MAFAWDHSFVAFCLVHIRCTSFVSSLIRLYRSRGSSGSSLRVGMWDAMGSIFHGITRLTAQHFVRRFFRAWSGAWVELDYCRSTVLFAASVDFVTWDNESTILSVDNVTSFVTSDNRSMVLSADKVTVVTWDNGSTVLSADKIPFVTSDNRSMVLSADKVPFVTSYNRNMVLFADEVTFAWYFLRTWDDRSIVLSADKATVLTWDDTGSTVLAVAKLLS